ncbi:MAG: dienelactone hydrolase family protein [Pseudonocardia sp.]|nr:dienelactone hydrolase family protein [Pseudonocardia sp.]
MAVLDHLQGRADVERLFAAGFCIGGHLAFRAALDPRVEATVCFYPTGLQDGALGADADAGSLARAADIGGRLMVVFGSRDPHVPPDARLQVVSALYAAGLTDLELHVYAGGDPAGMDDVEPGRDAKSPDLRGAYAHALKSVAVGRDGAVYVSVGSTGNVSVGDLTASPPRASILRIPPGGGAPEPYAVGVRNGTGLAVAPDGAVWTAVNNRDNVAYPFDRPYGETSGSSFGKVIAAYVRDHPAEALAKLTPGRNLGWPYCNPDPDVQPGVAGSAQNPSDVAFTNDVQLNPGGGKLDCATLPPVEATLGGHSAPLGLSFVDGTLPGAYARGALVGVHGSWNASPPRAPEVSFFPWENGGLGRQQTLVGGFQAADGSRWGRPVAAVAGPDGAVYITDDQAGAVYRLVPTRP